MFFLWILLASVRIQYSHTLSSHLIIPISLGVTSISIFLLNSHLLCIKGRPGLLMFVIYTYIEPWFLPLHSITVGTKYNWYDWKISWNLSRTLSTLKVPVNVIIQALFLRSLTLLFGKQASICSLRRRATAAGAFTPGAPWPRARRRGCSSASRGSQSLSSGTRAGDGDGEVGKWRLE